MMKHEHPSMMMPSNGTHISTHMHQMHLSPMQSLLQQVPTKPTITPKSKLNGSPKKGAKDTSKKVKVSRERQLKINAASRKCRRKQKVELQFLREHVVDLRRSMYEHSKTCTHMNTSVLDKTEQLMEELTSVATRVTKEENSSSDDESSTASRTLRSTMNTTMPIQNDTTQRFADGKTREELLTIGSFLRMNLNLESKTFSPDSISSLPIQMDGWRIRLGITERSYAFHNHKFFPCPPQDLFDFCWETSLNESQPCLHSSEYFKVAHLNEDMAYVSSRTIGQWSLLVHGVPNVSYNSILARMKEGNRFMVCQQSVLGPNDFADPATEPWLFKKWVVFQPYVCNGIAGTSVESYRCASYASGRRLYSETNTYDSFCEHIIRRYAESNVVLDRMMAQDGRFSHLPWNENNLFLFETMGERVVKDFLLF